MPVALSNPTLTINNEAITVVPNTVKYTEGFGEQNFRTQSAGGGSVQTVLSNNVETNFSKLMFEMYNTQENIDLIRSWKVNGNANAAELTGSGLNRSFSNMALINDYEVALGSDTTIPLEFASDPTT